MDTFIRNFVRSFFVTSIPFGLCMGAFYLVVFRDFSVVIKIALLSGVGYGFFMALFMTIFATAFTKSSRIKKSVTPVFEADEQIIHEGPANHFKGLEGVGGWLFLTSHRVVFKSHSFNIQRHVLSLPLSQIQSAHSARTLGLIPNGLHIQTQDGRIEKFVVEKHLDWNSKIISVLRAKSV